MAYSQEIKDRVRSAYVEQRLTMETAAASENVPYGTARRWRDAAVGTATDWDKARAAASLAAGDVESLAARNLFALLQAHARALEELETEKISAVKQSEVISSLSDAMVKGMAAYSRVTPETNQLAIASRTLALLIEYIKAEKPNLLNVFAPVLTDFGTRLPQLLGSKRKK